MVSTMTVDCFAGTVIQSAGIWRVTIGCLARRSIIQYMYPTSIKKESTNASLHCALGHPTLSNSLNTLR